MPNVAQVLVDQLSVLGADLVFGVPGESYLAVLNAMRDSSLRFVTCRHESGAVFAAAAHGELTGRPGIVLVTRGPGAMNAAVGVHSAQQAETPLLVLVGQAPQSQVGRDAFQEVDLVQIFASMCSWVHEISDPPRVGEIVASGWARSLAGRRGPVVIGLREDLLEGEVASATVRAAPPPRAGVDAETVKEVRASFDGAQRPVAIIGGTRWSDRALADLPTVLPGIALLTGFRRQDLVDHRHPQFAGTLGIGCDPALVSLVQESDLVVALGDRLDDPTTNGFSLFPCPDVGVPLVHVHPDPHELGRVWHSTIAIAAEPGTFLEAIGPLAVKSSWASWTARAREGYKTWAASPGLLDDVARGLRRILPDDAIVTNGAGNFTRPLHRSYAYHRPGRQLAPPGGSMGYGIPAAVAAKLTYPERVVVCVAGDGDFLMTSMELATAAHEGAAIIVLVVDNASYGTIRTHQEKRYPGRPFATALTNPDFAALGASFGMRAEQTRDAATTIDALDRAISSREASLVHLICD